MHVRTVTQVRGTGPAGELTSALNPLRIESVAHRARTAGSWRECHKAHTTDTQESSR